MEAVSRTLKEVFSRGGDVQYKLPHFQRAYAWEKSNWKTLFDDVMSVYEASATTTPEHFLGAIVVIEDGTHNVAMTTYKLVDGQQRLVTISLLLCAIANRVGDDSRLHRGVKKYLINSDEEEDLFFKIVPTEKYHDKEVYFSILNGQPAQNYKSLILDAYSFFEKQISIIERDKVDLGRLFEGIVNYMQVVFIKLNRKEQPYKIFESLNAKGKVLTQSDLVRNYIAMRLPAESQEQIFNEYWAKIEDILQDKRKTNRIGELTAFLRHYLAFVNRNLPKKNHVYARFRDRMEAEYPATERFIEEIKNLHQFALYYDKLLRPEGEPDEEIQKQLVRLDKLEAIPTYPFLMYLYDSYTKSEILREEFLNVLEVIENYLVRRFLSGDPMAYVHNMIPGLIREVCGDQILLEVKRALPSKRYPSDNRLSQNLLSNPINDRPQRKRVVFVLEALNRYLSKATDGYTVLRNKATIEHIMPQTMSPEWKNHIGASWAEVYEYLNFIGNLTIITQEWNATLSNSSFFKKRDMLVRHALLINKEYFSQEIERWDKDAIHTRTKYLTKLILEVWPALGESSLLVGVIRTKPTSLTILGETFDVKTWRDVAFHMAETAYELTDDPDALAREFNLHFSRQNKWRSSRKMSNGWWLNVHASAQNIISFCHKLASYVGFADEWNYTSD